MNRPCLLRLSALALLLPLAAARSSDAPQPADQAIRCANLIYAGTETSRCFSDQFLSSMQQLTAIPTERRFKSVKLASEELFGFPFVVMTGEDTFTLTAAERENLKKYLGSGGFLLASAGCSSGDWDKAFRREMRRIFPDQRLCNDGGDEAGFVCLLTVQRLHRRNFRCPGRDGSAWYRGLGSRYGIPQPR